MCDFGEIQKMTLNGSGRANGNWFNLHEAQVYHDHFIRAQVNEGIVLDIFNSESNEHVVGVCLELDSVSAEQLGNALLATVEGLRTRT
jgi:hypothetical protein